MREAGIGRVLVASLHQGISDILPIRLGFYENWLNAEGLREGTIGLAPLYAVLSFLRQEGEAYRLITTLRGEYAAEWTVQSMSPPQRAIIKASPVWLRSRMVLRLPAAGARAATAAAARSSRLRRGIASVDLRDSVFCSVRGPVPHPLCGFYAAAFTRLLALFDIGARTEVVACRGTGEPTCVLNVALPMASRRHSRRAYRRSMAPVVGDAPKRALCVLCALVSFVVLQRSARPRSADSRRCPGVVRACSRDAVRERQARRAHLLARRSVGRPARRRPQRARRATPSPGRSGCRRSSGCRCRRRPPSPTRP